MNIGNHHAYIIEGDRELILKDLEIYFKDTYNIAEATCPDIVYVEAPTLLVEHAKSVKELDLKSPFVLEKKRIILIFDSITREAQNALLKVLEEPSDSSVFLIVVRSTHMFLPTILSRVQVIYHEQKKIDKSLLDPKKFFQESLAKRLELVAEIIKKLGNEEIKRSEVVETIASLARCAVDSGKPYTLLELIDYKNDKSASLKLLLERLCLC